MLINLYDIYISLLNNFHIPYFVVFISILCRLSLVTFNIQNFSNGFYLKDFFSTFSQWVSFPFVGIILHEILSIEWTEFYSS
jgi:hypothetical protein